MHAPGSFTPATLCAFPAGRNITHIATVHLPTLYIYGSPAGVAQWIEHQTVNQSFTGSTPGQGTCLGTCLVAGQVPSRGGT